METDPLVVAAALPIRYVGVYALGSRLSAAARALPLNALGPLLTHLARRTADEAHSVDALASAQHAWVKALGGYVVAATFALTPAMAAWLGPRYWVSGLVAAILFAGMGVNLLTGVMTIYLRAVGRPDIEARYGWATTLTNVVLTVPGVLVGGVLGVASATGIAQVVGSLYLIRLVRQTPARQHANFLGSFPVIASVLAGVASGGAAWLVESAGLRGTPALLCAAVLGGIVWFAYLATVHPDWRQFRSAGEERQKPVAS